MLLGSSLHSLCVVRQSVPSNGDAISSGAWAHFKVHHPVFNMTTKSFFLIRIKSLPGVIGLKWSEEEYGVPLPGFILNKVKTISSNHVPSYIARVESIFDNLSEEEINWRPYTSLVLPPRIEEQLSSVTLLAPLFSNNNVVMHNPHVVARQFSVLDEYMTDSELDGWEEPKIPTVHNKFQLDSGFFSPLQRRYLSLSTSLLLSTAAALQRRYHRSQATRHQSLFRCLTKGKQF